MPTRGHQYGDARSTHFDPTINASHRTGHWQSCPILEWTSDPSIGVHLVEGFTSYNTSDYTLTQATSGSAAISTTVPGALAIDAGATTNHQGANVQRLKAAFVPAANKSIWAEFLVNTSFLTLETFIGLAASDTTIIASGAMTTNNRIGWTSVTGDGVLQFDVDKAGTGSQTTGTTLVAGTQVKLGFFYDGVADTVQQYVNNVAVGSAIATTYIPKVVIYPSLVCQTTGTSQPVLTVAGYRIFQLR